MFSYFTFNNIRRDSDIKIKPIKAMNKINSFLVIPLKLQKPLLYSNALKNFPEIFTFKNPNKFTRLKCFEIYWKQKK